MIITFVSVDYNSKKDSIIDFFHLNDAMLYQRRRKKLFLGPTKLNNKQHFIIFLIAFNKYILLGRIGPNIALLSTTTTRILLLFFFFLAYGKKALHSHIA